MTPVLLTSHFHVIFMWLRIPTISNSKCVKIVHRQAGIIDYWTSKKHVVKWRYSHKWSIKMVVVVRVPTQHTDFIGPHTRLVRNQNLVYDEKCINVWRLLQAKFYAWTQSSSFCWWLTTEKQTPRTRWYFRYIQQSLKHRSIFTTKEIPLVHSSNKDSGTENLESQHNT